jgi:GNAT superfamily N-acetyltransferase
MSLSVPVQVRRARVDEILDLRWRILRAGLPRDTACFDGDDEATTLHTVAVCRGVVIGCVTILRRAWQDRAAWQLRGMAVAPEYQGRGIGGTLLEAVEADVRARPYSLQLWCNARSPATPFYAKHGWHLVGDEFVIPTAGPHFKMSKLLKPDDPTVR